MGIDYNRSIEVTKEAKPFDICTIGTLLELVLSPIEGLESNCCDFTAGLASSTFEEYAQDGAPAA